MLHLEQQLTPLSVYMLFLETNTKNIYNNPILEKDQSINNITILHRNILFNGDAVFK
jgi:hypothetical protein